jgi:putative sigma-54 modulation protein
MNVNFTARHTELTEDIKDYCQKRLKRMEKILRDVQQIDIILSEEKSRKRVDLQIKHKGEDFVVSEETNEMFNSLNQAFDSLEKKIIKERRKLIQKRHRSSSRELPAAGLEAEETAPRVIRVAYYSDKPLSVQEALLQLEEGKKEVFLFRREGSGNWVVVFRRKDGKFGLVDPEE